MKRYLIFFLIVLSFSLGPRFVHAASEGEVFAKVELGKEIFHFLDFKSFRSSFGPKLDHVKTLEDFVSFDCPTARVEIRAMLVEVRCSDWEYRVSVLRRGDFTGDGAEDLVLELVDRSLVGTYSTRSQLTVSRIPGTSRIFFSKKERNLRLESG